MYVLHRRVTSMSIYPVLLSRVGNFHPMFPTTSELSLLLLLAEMICKEHQSCRQRIKGWLRRSKQWLYQALGFEQLDQWLLQEMIYAKKRWYHLEVSINTYLGVLLINAVLDQVKPLVWILLVEIIKAATPHIGITAYQLLNHTVKVWKAVRDGLER